jgi:hypothetical protein
MASSKYKSVLTAAIFLAACGGSDDDGGGGGGGSYTDIADAISSPTGTIDKDTAPDVAAEFEKVLQGSAGGVSKQSGTQEMACPSGGKITTTVEGNESAATAEAKYDSCCYQADCCYDGRATTFFSNAGASGGSTSADFSFCVNADLTLSCGSETPVDGQFEYCYGAGGITYVVRLNGDSFAVSGSYSNGNGTLTIKGKNGTFECTYTNGSGSCTGDAGDFDF